MSDMKKGHKFVLTGTTGNLGSLVLKHLLTQLPASSLIISLYNPANSALKLKGIDVRRGDYGDPASLDKAFLGADVLFLMSYPSIRHQVRVKAHINAIDAAKRSGTIKHIVYTSLAFAGGPNSSQSIAAVMRAHLDTEAYLKSSLLPNMTYTILREGLYTESFPLYFGAYDIVTKPSEVSIPEGDGDKPIAFTKREDLAEATAQVIVSITSANVDFMNKTLLLAAEPRHSLQSLGMLIGEITGTPVTVKRVPTKEYAAPHSRASRFIGSADMARDWASTYPAIGLGETSYRGEGSNMLERLLGRKPEEVENVIEAMLK